MAAAATTGLVIAGIWMLVALAFLIWYLWAMSRLFPRIGLQAAHGWIPVFNQWKLLERAGLPGWIVLLSFVGLGVVPLIFLIIAMHRINTEAGVGAGYTVLGVFIPPLWAMLLASAIGARVIPGQGRGYAGSAYAPAPAAAPYARSSMPPVAPPAAPAGSAPAAPQAWAAPQASAAMPPVPPSPAPAPPAPQAYAAPAAAGSRAAAPVPPASASVPAAPPAPVPPVSTPPGPAPSASGPAAPVQPSPFGAATDAEYARLAAEPFVAPPAVPLGQHADPEPFSWTAASKSVPDAAPAQPTLPVQPIPPAPAAPSSQAPSAPAPASVPAAPAPSVAPPADVVPAPVSANGRSSGITGVFAPLPADPGEDLDRTIVVPRKPNVRWELVLPDGDALVLEADTVVGRRPEPIDGSAVLAIPDPTRTLSKSHARLRFDGERWTVEDLGSTNGLAILGENGAEEELEPHRAIEASPVMRFGTLRVELRSVEG